MSNIFNTSEWARKNGMTKDEYIDQVCKNFIALMSVKMDEQGGGEAVMLRFGGFTVVTRKDTDE